MRLQDGWLAVIRTREGRIGAALAAGLMLRALTAWQSAATMVRDQAGLPFEAFFTPGLVSVVETARATGATRVFGPHHDRSPYVFQRFREMLFPVVYETWGTATAFAAGDVVLLFPDDELPVPVRALYEHHPFRFVEVIP